MELFAKHISDLQNESKHHWENVHFTPVHTRLPFMPVLSQLTVFALASADTGSKGWQTMRFEKEMERREKQRWR